MHGQLRLLALLRPAPGLIQELAGFCMNMHAVLLECRAGSTSRHRGKTRLPSTLCRPAARAPEAGTGSRTKMAPGMDSKKNHQGIKETRQTPPSTSGPAVAVGSMACRPGKHGNEGSPPSFQTTDKPSSSEAGPPALRASCKPAKNTTCFVYAVTCTQSSPWPAFPWAFSSAWEASASPAEVRCNTCKTTNKATLSFFGGSSHVTSTVSSASTWLF